MPKSKDQHVTFQDKSEPDFVKDIDEPKVEPCDGTGVAENTANTKINHETEAAVNEISIDSKEMGYLPERFRNPSLQKGYGRDVNALYRTTSSDYGSRPPNELTIPAKYFGFTRKFTTHLSVCDLKSIVLGSDILSVKPLERVMRGHIRRRKRKLDEEATEYERRYKRSSAFDSDPPLKKVRPLLPIKSKSGVLIQQFREEDVATDEEKDIEDEEPVKSTSENADVPIPMNIQQIKSEIAKICSNVVNDPQNHVKELKKLLAMLWETKPYRTCLIIRKLAMASLTCVFIDIIPGYRIRQLTEEERSVKLSKEVKSLVEFEERLLKHYQNFLSSLEKVVTNDYTKKSKLSKQEQKEMTVLGVKSLCELYEKTTHFNFHQNIAVVLLPFANSNNKVISEMCCTAIRNLFRSDKNAKLVREGCASKKGVRPSIVETFLSLHINHVDFESMSKDSKRMTAKEKKKAAEEKKKLSRAQKKYLKRKEQLQSELKETEAIESRETKVKYHTETIQQVFLVYFRILKHKKGQVLHKRLLNTVLQGLSQFAHLINIDFFSDLVLVLQKLVTSGDLNFKQNLYCIFTTFKVLSGQGEALNIDPSEFYKYLYATLTDVVYISVGPLNSRKKDGVVKSNELELIMECLNIMLDKRRKQVTLNRLQAFVKRICAVSMNVHPGSTANSMLTIAAKLLQSNSKTSGLFDPESQVKGIYLPELEDPEHSGSTSTCLWELHALRRHFCPDVQNQSLRILKDSSSL